MKKMNNKGFLLVETLIVATFVLTVLVLLYIQFKNLVVNYNNSYNYNTVEGIYNLNAVKKYLIENDVDTEKLYQKLANKKLANNEKPYLVIYDGSGCNKSLGLYGTGLCDKIAEKGNFKKILYASADATSLKELAKTTNSDMSEDMRNFIKLLKSSENVNRLIAEYNDGTFATIVYDRSEKYSLSSFIGRAEDCGLYDDPLEKGRHIFRGDDPCNYIKLDKDIYRIISIESDGTFKVIKNEPLADKLIWDPGYSSTINKTGGIKANNTTSGTRYSSNTADYCYHTPMENYSGCNVWSKSNSTLNASKNGIQAMPRVLGNATTYNLPSDDSYINYYLNNKFLNTLSENVKSKITEHIFEVGPIKRNNQLLSEDALQSANYKWLGQIGLMSALDYVKADLNDTCRTVFYSSGSCEHRNWLKKNVYEWTMSPVFPTSTTSGDFVWNISSSGQLLYSAASNGPLSVRPVFYLTSDIKLSGTGTNKDNAYIIY
ncbi:MAG: hypothetical protein IJ093_03995 [Bacilli bacterium]|nr:hypothetical protein [Bacilli bacterium]